MLENSECIIIIISDTVLQHLSLSLCLCLSLTLNLSLSLFLCIFVIFTGYFCHTHEVPVKEVVRQVRVVSVGRSELRKRREECGVVHVRDNFRITLLSFQTSEGKNVG